MTPLPLVLAQRISDGYHHILRADIDRLGLDPHVLQRWVSAGHLEPLAHGEYVIATHLDPALAPWTVARTRRLWRCEAVLAGNPSLHLAGASALIGYGLPLLNTPSCVIVSGSKRARPSRPHLCTRMPWGSSPHPVKSLRCQQAAEAVVEVAAMEGTAAGLVCADALANRNGARGELATAVTSYGLRPGVRRARKVLELLDPLSESPGESLTRLICHEARIALESQVIIHDDEGHFVARVDFIVSGTRTVLEFDGLEKYTGGGMLRAEKHRQVALERLGYRVLRLTWDDLRRPATLAARVHREISLAAA